jgi:hypothetical protein
MTPIRYSKNKDGSTRFHYSFKDLRTWINYAYEGCAGQILWGRNGYRIIYKCSGTLENPRPVTTVKDLITLIMMHNEIFDGKMKTDDQYLIPSTYDFLKNSRMIFLDMSYYDNKPNINDTRFNR